jgi:hypothetical protein
VVCISISMVINVVKHIFICLLVIHISYWEKCLFKSFAYFSNVLLCCFYCRHYLYVLNINPLSDIWFASTFSHFVGCLFTLLIVSFAIHSLIVFWYTFLRRWEGGRVTVREPHMVHLLSVLR